MKISRKQAIEKINKKLQKVKQMTDLEFSIVFNSDSELLNLCFLDVTKLMLKNKKFYFSCSDMKNIIL
mgnify:CR=1 FL=1